MIDVDRHSASAYARPSEGRRRSRLAVHETSPAEPAKPRLLDRVRTALRSRHYSRRTEEAYVAWIRRYILFHGKRHPMEMGAPEITRFLSFLAVDGKVAASTQNQALSALLFLYREVLELDVPWLDGLVRAKRPERLPVVLTREEVRAVIQRLEGVPRLMAYLLYGAGLRVLECCRLRVQDVDFATNQIVVRGGKGDKDRVTMLPVAVKRALARHLESVREQHQDDLKHGAGWVYRYSRRLAVVEPVFANICSAHRLRRFSLRGARKVNTQWLLYCVVHNVAKVQRYGASPGRAACST